MLSSVPNRYTRCFFAALNLNLHNLQELSLPDYHDHAHISRLSISRQQKCNRQKMTSDSASRVHSLIADIEQLSTRPSSLWLHFKIPFIISIMHIFTDHPKTTIKSYQKKILTCATPAALFQAWRSLSTRASSGMRSASAARCASSQSATRVSSRATRKWSACPAMRRTSRRGASSATGWVTRFYYSTSFLLLIYF